MAHVTSVELTRTVRFCPGGEHGPNGYAGSPAMQGVGVFYELHVRCRGGIDPVTGYLINIQHVDQAVREHVLPALERARGDEHPASALAPLLAPLNKALHGGVVSLCWNLSPYYCVEMSPSSPTALVRQRFDFSASHRLHAPSLSAEENRALFGKCNYPSGHGHNYQVEPCVLVPMGKDARPAFTLRQLEELTMRVVVEPFDHKNLNVDTPPFNQPGGPNPSVENIAKVFFDLLAPEIARTGGGATLRDLTVWETDRTCATYPAAS